MRAVLTLPLALLASATELYVSPSGSDNDDGTSADTPFRTLAKAQESVRALTDEMDEDITVNVASGTYNLSEPLQFGAADSGQNGFTVRWVGSDATLSGGLKVEGWTEESDGVYSAQVPAGTASRNLYVDGQAANYARRKVDNREDFAYSETGITWTSSAYDWITSTPGIENAEVRFINSFTDRYAPIDSVGDHELVMKQTGWANQIIGYDTVSDPFADFGVWVQNARALLTEGGQFYLDSEEGVVYYMPLDGEDMSAVETYLGIQETLISVSGTYDDPAHDISFEGLVFAHSTWLFPGQGHGYVDQQTGGYIEPNTTYPEFEATRPHWWQMPSAVQISAATNITMTGCSYTQLGAGGIGIGNDANAHISEVGLGASHVSIKDGYFTQVMGNSITAGGIQADAHHPSDERMTNSDITISGNIFYNNSALFSSTVNILATYLHDSTIAHNDIDTTPYSGICHGYGWGSNDAGGSQEYINRGLYNYQPLYEDPTTLHDNLIEGNLVHNYGFSHTDLGAVYTLSSALGTTIADNYVYDSAGGYGIYPDEGSSNMTYAGNACFSNGGWYSPNDWSDTLGTEYNTVIDNWGKVGDTLDGFPDHTGRRENTFLRNYVVEAITDTSMAGQRAAYRAGVLPGKREGRPVSNSEDLADGYLEITGADGQVSLNVTNFDDVDFTDVSFEASGEGFTLNPVDLPTSIPADSFAVAVYSVDGSGNVEASASYTNPRTGKAGTVVASGSI